MRQRPLKMDAWGISFDAYKELYHFCQQYGEKKRRAESIKGAAKPNPALAYEQRPIAGNGDELFTDLSTYGKGGPT